MTIDVVKKLHKDGKYDEALELCNTLIDELSDSYELYEKRAAIFSRLNQLGSAIDDMDRVIELVPNVAAPHFGKSEYLMEEKRDDEAVYHLSEAERLDNGYFGDTIYFVRSIAYLRQKKYDKALSDVNRISNDFDLAFGMFGYESVSELRETIDKYL